MNLIPVRVWVGGFLLALVMAGAFELYHAGESAGARREQTATLTARLDTQHVASVAAAIRVDTVREKLAGAIRLVAGPASFRVDTVLLRAPQTPAETVQVVREAPIVAAKFDTLQRSCSALVLTCQEYRASAEIRFAADSGEKASLRGLLALRPAPSGLSLKERLGWALAGALVSRVVR